MTDWMMHPFVPLSSSHSINKAMLCFHMQCRVHSPFFLWYASMGLKVKKIKIKNSSAQSMHVSLHLPPGDCRLIKFALQHVYLSICRGWVLRRCRDTQKKNNPPQSVTQLTLPIGQRLMNDYFCLPAGVAHSPVAAEVKETQFRRDKSQGDNLRWFNQLRTDCCRQGKHNQEELVYWSLKKHTHTHTRTCSGC